MKVTKRALALFAGLCVLAAGAVSVRADSGGIRFTKSLIDADRACSVTIRDYVSNNGEAAIVIDGNAIDVPGVLPDGAKPVSDAVFGFMRIADLALSEHEGVVEMTFIHTARPFLDLVQEKLPKDYEEKEAYTADELRTYADRLGSIAEPDVRRLITRYGEVMPDTDEDGMSSVSGLPTGLYLFAEIKSPDGVVPGAPFSLLLPQTNITGMTIDAEEFAPGEIWLYDVTVYPKGRSVSISKSIAVDGDGSGKGEASDNTMDRAMGQTTACIGDTVTFLVTTDVPTVSGSAHNRLYEIEDEMDKGLSYDGILSVTLGVSEDTAVTLTEKSDYKTNVTRTDSGEELHIAFTKKGLARLDRVSEASRVYLRYRAVLNPSAKIAGDGNRNIARLVYGTDHSDDINVTSLPVTVYTYELRLKKTFTPAAEHFGKVRFSVMAGEKKLSFVKESDGVYHTAGGDWEKEATELVSPGDLSGVLHIKGLANGTYILTEEETLDDYSLLRKPVEVTIKNRNMELDVENSKSIDLVHTGGVGLVGTFAAAATLCAAGILILCHAKRNS